MHSDFSDLLADFNAHNVEYMIVGGYAAIHYSQPRYTKDLADIEEINRADS